MNEINNDVLQSVLAQLCGISEVKETDSLSEDLGLDSLARVTLLVMLEETFQIEFLVSDLDHFALNTVGDIADLLKKYTPGGHS